MKFKHIEEGMEIKILYGMFKDVSWTISKVDHKHKWITVSTASGDFMFYKEERGSLWDIHKEPKEATRLKKNDYENLLDMALAMKDEAWFKEIHAAMQGVGVRSL